MMRCGNSLTPSGSSSVRLVRTIFDGLAGSGPQKFIEVRWNASATRRSANPKAWNVSTLRAWTPSAWPISSRPGRRSIRRVLITGY